MSDLRTRVKEFLVEEQETLKHLQGQHNQKLHGNRGGVPSSKRNVAQLKRDYHAASSAVESLTKEKSDAHNNFLREGNKMMDATDNPPTKVSSMKNGDFFASKSKRFSPPEYFMVKNGGVYKLNKNNSKLMSRVKNPPDNGFIANDYVNAFRKYKKIESALSKAISTFGQLSKELGEDVY